MLQFTHLLMEAKSKYSPNIKPYLKTHDIVDSVDGFSHIGLNYHMLPPIKIKTRPTIFIMKRKTNIKYDPDKARSRVSTEDFLQEIDNAEEVELNTRGEMTVEIKPIFDDIVESLEEFEEPEEIGEQSFSDIELEYIMETSDNIEEKTNRLSDFADDNVASVKSVPTTNTNKQSSNLKNKKREEDSDLQEDFENVSNIDSAKSDEEVKPKIEEDKVIKGRFKNGLNLRQENHSIKETVKKMIQEKMQKVKQKREIKDEQKNMDLPIKPMKEKEIVATELPGKIKILKQEPKETSILIDKTAMVKEKVTVTKGVVKDEDMIAKEKFIKARNITQKTDKIKTTKPDLEKVVIEEDISVKRENEDTVSKQKYIKAKNITQRLNKMKTMKPDLENVVNKEDTYVKQKNETVNITTEKIVKAEDKVDAGSSIIEEKIIRGDDRENVKAQKLVRESIRNIINQFKDFEKDFMYDDIDFKSAASDTSDENRIESDITEKGSIAIDYLAKSEDQLTLKDPRESLKEIIDQFKYIKHELTSDEDDQFDDIAAKYMERPIAETLLQFNEALKNLMQRRRKISVPEQTTILKYNKDDHTSEDSLQIKQAKKTKVAENDRNNERAKVLRIKSNGKQESAIVNRLKHDHNEVSDVKKNVNTPISTEKVSMDAQQHNDKTLNNVSKTDIAKKENSQKNTENSRSE